MSKYVIKKGNLRTETIENKNDPHLLTQILKFDTDEKGTILALINTKIDHTIDIAFIDNKKRCNELKRNLKIIQQYEEYL